MPYALFEHDERLTPAFRTEREVWEAAEQADLITLDTHGEKILDNDFEIRSCEVPPEGLADRGSGLALPVIRDVDLAPPENRSAEAPLPSPRKAPSETS